MPNVSDMIAPGEFSFCPRCGSPDSCVPGPKSRLCRRCYPVVRELNPSEQEYETEIRRLCNGVYALRTKLAEARKQQPLKPLWWRR